MEPNWGNPLLWFGVANQLPQLEAIVTKLLNIYGGLQKPNIGVLKKAIFLLIN